MVPDSMTKAQAVAYLATYYVLARLFWLAVEEITRECREQLAARRMRTQRRRRRKNVDFRVSNGSGRIVLQDGDYVLKEVE